ncbi:MAG: glycosyltransferase [Porphyromonadaceae bacterium]|nr:glycosyltransferase [Porphyromonadaceae bacterium]
MYKATLIISVYDNIKFLKLVLDSLLLQTEKNFEVIISEDGENTAMANFIKSYPFENDYQHLTQEDIGWRKNRALNNAIRNAKSDWLIFIDGDCVLHPRFVEMHVRYADEKLILAGKRVKMDEETSLYLENNFSTAIHELQKMFLKKLIVGKGKTAFIEESIFINPSGIFGFIPKIRKVRRLIGSNMSFSKKAIYAINGFDEAYKLPAVGEDTDLYWRFKLAGYQPKSVRNLAVQYHLYHVELWSDSVENRAVMEKKQLEGRFFCKEGLITEANSTE